MVNKNIDSICIFLISFLYSFFLFFNVCEVYPKGDFDSQALLSWNYNSTIRMLPYKDVFYPYGILSYYNNHILFFTIIYIFLLPLLVTTIYSVINTLLKNKLLSITFLILFATLVSLFSGWEIFNRYGILTVITLYTTCYFYSHKNIPISFLLKISVLCGLVFSFITDQGIYSFSFFLLILTSFHFFNHQKISLLKQTVFSMVGFCLGSLPLIYFLITHQMVRDFFISTMKLSDIALYAKAPFLPGSKTSENLFVFSILYLSIFFVSFIILFEKKKFSLATSLQINLIIVLVFLEQKNLMRSIDRQLVFIGVLLALFFLYDFICYIKKRTTEKQVIIILSVLGIYFLLLIMTFTKSTLSLPLLRTSSDSLCLKKNTSELVYGKKYEQLRNSITSSASSPVKIFSFPSDPILYLFFNQRTPYFSNTYDASSLYAQKKQIEYVKINNVTNVIINSSITAIQDGVPEYIRSRILMKYIFTHFRPVKKFQQYIILEKAEKGANIVTDNILSQDYKDFLLRVDFGNVPSIEGIQYYKKSYSNKLIFKSLKTFNTFLSTNKFSTHNKSLFLFPKSKNAVYNLTLQTQTNEKTIVSFKKCARDIPCLLDLSLIPLFYNDKTLQSIFSNEDFAVVLK